MNVRESDGTVDGYMMLAEAIIEQAAEDYSYLFPTTATSQSEFTYLDTVGGYVFQRECLINRLVHSCVRSVVDYDVCKTAFERRRHIEMQRLGIRWK